jgi:KamA family protein
MNDTTQSRFRAITRANITQRPEWGRLSPALQEAVQIVSLVLPFRTNAYVVDELIDWDRVPNDPMYQLTFPQRGMLDDESYAVLAGLVRKGAAPNRVYAEVNRIRFQLNPHPAGQMTHNVPKLDATPVEGVQHKYRETVLFFPSQGQTCHAYCTFCFRWAQFVGIDELKFANHDAELLVRYLRRHPRVTDVLFTGGDPLIMRSAALRRYIEPLLRSDLSQIQSIRIGTKAVAYWPQRFVTDDDADDLMRLFEDVVASGRNLALMGHYGHPVELSTKMARTALARIRASGATVRMQAPLTRHVNDSAHTWAELWRTGVRLGAVPYYMFIERDTGARSYFEVPLARAWEIFRGAYQQVSGLARTVRGPSMSTFPGKVHVLGVRELFGEKVFILEYLQARDPALVRRPFFAKFDAGATWFDDLEPYSDDDVPFFPHRFADDEETIRLAPEGRAVAG